MLRLLRRPLNLPPDRLLEIHLPRHNNRREPDVPGARFPGRSKHSAQLGEPFALEKTVADWYLRRRRVDASFGEQGDVLMLLIRYGLINVSKTDADLSFALIQ